MGLSLVKLYHPKLPVDNTLASYYTLYYSIDIEDNYIDMDEIYEQRSREQQLEQYEVKEELQIEHPRV